MFELLYKLHFVTVWYCRNIVWCAKCENLRHCTLPASCITYWLPFDSRFCLASVFCWPSSILLIV